MRPRRPRDVSLTGLVALVAVLVLVTVPAGCGFRVGSPESESAWRTKADQVLGTATSSLGTAELLLENRAQGNLTRAYVVVAMRDAVKTLGKEVEKFSTVQPPPPLRRDSDKTVSGLQQAAEVLEHATVAISSGDADARSEALREVRRTEKAVSSLSDEVGP